MEPQPTNFIPEADQAVALPTPELAMRLLRYLVVLEDQSGGYGNNLNASRLDPDAVAHAQIWPDHTGEQHDPLFLRAISEAWWWLHPMTATRTQNTSPSAGQPSRRRRTASTTSPAIGTGQMLVSLLGLRERTVGDQDLAVANQNCCVWRLHFIILGEIRANAASRPGSPCSS